MNANCFFLLLPGHGKIHRKYRENSLKMYRILYTISIYKGRCTLKGLWPLVDRPFSIHTHIQVHCTMMVKSPLNHLSKNTFFMLDHHPIVYHFFIFFKLINWLLTSFHLTFYPCRPWSVTLHWPQVNWFCLIF